MTEVKDVMFLGSRSGVPAGANDRGRSRGHSSDVPTGLGASVTERRGDGHGSWVDADYVPGDARGRWSFAPRYARGPTSFWAR